MHVKRWHCPTSKICSDVRSTRTSLATSKASTTGLTTSLQRAKTICSAESTVEEDFYQCTFGQANTISLSLSLSCTPRFSVPCPDEATPHNLQSVPLCFFLSLSSVASFCLSICRFALSCFLSMCSLSACPSVAVLYLSVILSLSLSLSIYSV